MADKSYLDSGMDLLALDCITKADVQQAITQAQPKVDTGFVILSETAPDVVTYPALARFLWLQTSGGNALKKLYYYNGTNWTSLLLVTADDILNGTITLPKLNLSGSAPYDIIQVNAAGTAAGWVSVVNAIINGSVPLTKLVPPAAGTYVLMGVGSTWAIVSIDNFPTYLLDNDVPVAKLVKGGISTAGLLLTTSADGTTIAWSQFDSASQIDLASVPVEKIKNAINDIAGPNGTALQSIQRNASNNAWQFYTPVTAADYNAAIAAAVATALAKVNASAFKVYSPSTWLTPIVGPLYNQPWIVTAFDVSGVYTLTDDGFGNYLTSFFTIPTTGYWEFTLNVRLPALATAFTGSLQQNGSVNIIEWDIPGTTDAATFSFTAVVFLTAGDTLKTLFSQNPVGGGTAEVDSNFSGYLLKAT